MSEVKIGFYYRGSEHNALLEAIAYWDGETLDMITDDDVGWTESVVWAVNFETNDIEGRFTYIGS